MSKSSAVKKKELTSKDVSRAAALLAADLASGRLAESYLFLGTPETGRLALAHDFAKAINCESSLNKAEACGDCASCRKIADGNHPDVFTLNFDSQAKILDLDDDEARRQKELRIDSVRILIRQSQMTPLEGSKRVLIIDGAELLTAEAANALLKSLEESTPAAHWILLATSVERVIPTIQSRCRKVSLASAESETEKPDPAAEEIVDHCAARATGLDPIALSQTIFADKKKGGARVRAEQVLRQVALGLSRELNETPTAKFALMLQSVFEAQEDVRRNVSPQLVMDSLLYTLQSRI